MKRVLMALLILLMFSVNIQAQDASVTANVAGIEQAATLNLDGFGTAAINVTGTWVGTLTFEAMVDNTGCSGPCWFTVNVFTVSGFTAVTTTTTNGQWLTGVAGYRSLRVRASAYTSGTAVITIRAAAATTGPDVTASRLPAADVLADNTANPSITKVQTFPMFWDGGTWDRWRGFTLICETMAGTQCAEISNGAPLSSDLSLTVRQVGFPNAAALTDNTANPTLTKIQTFPMVWDGTTWDRWNGDVIVTNGAVTVQPGSQTLAEGFAADGAPVLGDPLRIAGKDGSGNTQDIITDAAGELQVDVLTLPALPTGANNIGDVDIASLPKAATPSVSSVADSATNVTCLASNASRLGATIFNDSAADLYVKFGATASTTSFTVKVFQDGFLLVPFGYTGIIDCIWSADTAGSARVTEVTQ